MRVNVMCRQALESEIVAHEPMMEAVSSMAHHMVAKKHPAVQEIEAKLSGLRAELDQLKQLTAERKLKLTDAVESQTVCRFLYYSHILLLYTLFNFIRKFSYHLCRNTLL